MAYVRLGAQWFVRVVLCTLLALVAFAVTVLIVIPRASHGVALTVLTGSMTPKIPVGSVVIDRPVDPGTLKVGDIATYQKTPGRPEYITHRIVGINTRSTPVTFTFKGDANRGPDIDPVPATAIRGKVWFHVPNLGAIRDSIQSRGSRGIVLLLAVIGLAGFALYQLAPAVRTRGRTDAVVLRFPPDAFDGAAPTVARLFGGTCVIDDETNIATMSFVADSARRRVIEELLAPHQLREDGENPESAQNRPRGHGSGAHARR